MATLNTYIIKEKTYLNAVWLYAEQIELAVNILDRSLYNMAKSSWIEKKNVLDKKRLCITADLHWEYWYPILSIQ